MTPDLVPLAYHLETADRLRALEPQAWAVFARAAGHAVPATGSATIEDGDAADSPADDLEQQLLRHAYRLEAESHPAVHAAAERARGALGIAVPVAIYQLEGGERPNAALAYRPNEALIAISGDLLALLDDDELAACLGHELAHHALWSRDGSRILVADRLLAALSAHAGTPPPFLEAGRRFDLATELFADRGAVLACGALEPAITSLVKIATGLRTVDPAAYLRQAADAHPERGSAAATHPETVLRAWALERWVAGEGEAAAQSLLRPGLDVERLDLVDREVLEAVTRQLVRDALAPEWMRSEAVTAHARQFLVDVSPRAALARGLLGRRAGPQATPAGSEAGLPAVARIPDGASVETRRFLSYVLLDIATVDPELDDEALVECIAVAREAGLAADFAAVAKKELGINQKPWDALDRRASARRARPALATEPAGVEGEPSTEPERPAPVAPEPAAAEPGLEVAEAQPAPAEPQPAEGPEPAAEPTPAKPGPEPEPPGWPAAGAPVDEDGAQ